MPNIKPISDLRNYTEVLRDISVDEPVFLTKNGRGRFVIMDIADYERIQSTIKLINALAEGKESAIKDGYISSSKVKDILGL